MEMVLPGVVFFILLPSNGRLDDLRHNPCECFLAPLLPFLVVIIFVNLNKNILYSICIPFKQTINLFQFTRGPYLSVWQLPRTDH